MAQTATNILLGPIRLFYAPVGTAIPDRDSVTFGASWGGSWVEFGYTKAPLSATYDYTELEIRAQQKPGTLKRRKVTEDFMCETVLAEMTSTLFGIVASGTATSAAADSDEVGYDQMVVGGEFEVDEYAFGFEGLYESSAGSDFPARVFIYKGTAKMNGASEFSTEDYPGIPIQIKALQQPSNSNGDQLFRFERVTAAITA